MFLIAYIILNFLIKSKKHNFCLPKKTIFIFTFFSNSCLTFNVKSTLWKLSKCLNTYYLYNYKDVGILVGVILTRKFLRDASQMESNYFDDNIYWSVSGNKCHNIKLQNYKLMMDYLAQNVEV